MKTIFNVINGWVGVVFYVSRAKRFLLLNQDTLLRVYRGPGEPLELFDIWKNLCGKDGMLAVRGFALLILAASCTVRVPCKVGDPGCSAQTLLLYFLVASSACPVSGRILTVHANGTATSSIYSPGDGSISAGPVMPANFNADSFGVTIPSGPRACQNLLIPAGSTPALVFFDSSRNLAVLGPTLQTNAGVGAHAIVYSRGGAARVLVVHGDVTNSTSILDLVTLSVIAGPVLSGNAGNGAGFFEIASGGNAGKFLIYHANSSNGSSVFDPQTETMAVGPAVVANTGSGSSSFLITAGANNGNVFLSGCGGGVANNIYIPASHSIVNPSLPFNSLCTGGGSSFPVKSGPLAGEHLNLISGSNADRYVDASNSIVSGPALSSCAIGAGSHNILIRSGVNEGKQLIVCAGGLTNTNLFTPATGTFSVGPPLSSNASTGSRSVDLAY